MGKYFTLIELCKSETAAKIGLTNVPNDSVKKNIIRLIDEVLDPLREAWGKPIICTSGYRSPTVNAMVGGSKTSHHMIGCAADIKTKEGKEGNKKLFALAQKIGIPFTQLIDESGYAWLHISWDPNHKKQKQILHLK